MTKLVKIIDQMCEMSSAPCFQVCVMTLHQIAVLFFDKQSPLLENHTIFSFDDPLPDRATHKVKGHQVKKKQK